MLDADLFGHIRNILSLVKLYFWLSRLPIVGHEEDGVRALEGVCQRGFGAQVGLRTVSVNVGVM